MRWIKPTAPIYDNVTAKVTHVAHKKSTGFFTKKH
jgi:hypothetical protein